MEEQWLHLKLFICIRIPLSDRQFRILSPRIATQGSRFSCIMKLISLVSLLPMNTAVCERGLSKMNQIKSQSRSGMGSAILNSLMTISIKGPNLEMFDPQPAVNHCSSEAHRRPGYRKPSKSKPILRM